MICSDLIIHFVRIIESPFGVIINSHPVVSIFMFPAHTHHEVPFSHVAEVLLVISQAIVQAVPEDCSKHFNQTSLIVLIDPPGWP